MAALSMTVQGLADGLQYVTQIRDAVGRFAGPLVSVGSPLPYAYGIEYGRKRSGALARKAGPAYYLQGGLEAVQDEAKGVITAALPQGPGAVDVAAQRLGEIAQQRAQAIVPVRSGALRNSIVSRPRT